MHDKDIVAAALARLAERIGDDRFELWFGANVRVEARNSKESGRPIASWQAASRSRRKFRRSQF